MATVGALNGTAVLIQAFIDPDWVSIGGQVSHSNTLNNNLIDITNKVGDPSFRELLDSEGVQSMDATIDVIFVSQAGYDFIRAKAGTKEQVQFRTVNEGVRDSSFTGQIVSFTDTSPSGDVFRGSVTIQSSSDDVILYPGPTDEFWDQVEMMLHFDGVTGSTDIVDSSLVGTTFSVFGATNLRPFPAQGGISSVKLERDFGTDYIMSNLPSSAYKFLHDVSTPFTLECWVQSQWNDIQQIFSTGGELAARVGINLMVISGYRVQFRVSNGGEAGPENVNIFTSSNSLPFNTFGHVAVTFDGSTYRIFMNGVLNVSSAPSWGTPSLNDPAHTAVIGRNNIDGDEYFKGYIDELRLTKGVARYTENFTVPIEPYPNQ